MRLLIKHPTKVALSYFLKPSMLILPVLLNAIFGSLLTTLSFTIIFGGVLSDIGYLVQALIWIIPGNLYLLYHLIDIKMYAKSTSVELTDNGLVVSSNSIKQNINATISFENLAGVTVIQSFFMKLFGLTGLSIQSESRERFTPWGFEHKETIKFAQEVLDKHRVLFRQTRK
ncbi:MAG: hypothetical protein GW946_02725 [Candidatus Pacebacteria bacterium]|nr:hypothetical protein [Candidatus Paceibacterota bacterium]PIR60543.1 MAG: hypothetical protein COU67_02090 [Candidatus Pacebacteria bacterium CG10_big_fil_rev_8_21_14_0_10_44_54]